MWIGLPSRMVHFRKPLRKRRLVTQGGSISTRFPLDGGGGVGKDEIMEIIMGYPPSLGSDLCNSPREG